VQRVLLAIAAIILSVLLTDSVMHDPDVHPATVRGYERLRSTANSALDRLLGRGAAAPDPSSDAEVMAPAADSGRTHSPVGYWYWSTIAVVVGAGIWLLTLAVTVTFRNRSGPADHDASLSRGPQP
jgi:hypothetical protein